MTLAIRWAVCLPILAAALDDMPPYGVDFSIDDKGTIFIHPDSDSAGIGFAEIPEEGVGEAAVRLVDLLANDLPTTTRGWGRAVFACRERSHAHTLMANWNGDANAVELSCPDDVDVVIRQIRLPRLT